MIGPQPEADTFALRSRPNKWVENSRSYSASRCGPVSGALLMSHDRHRAHSKIHENSLVKRFKRLLRPSHVNPKLWTLVHSQGETGMKIGQVAGQAG